MYRFEWDDEKNARNIRKHGIDFADVTGMFDHPMLIKWDDREDYGETRWIAIGWIQTHMGVVVYAEPDADVIRIISARKATQREMLKYEKHIQY